MFGHNDSGCRSVVKEFDLEYLPGDRRWVDRVDMESG
jgi:hypothetical protein